MQSRRVEGRGGCKTRASSPSPFRERVYALWHGLVGAHTGPPAHHHHGLPRCTLPPPRPDTQRTRSTKAFALNHAGRAPRGDAQLGLRSPSEEARRRVPRRVRTSACSSELDGWMVWTNEWMSALLASCLGSRWLRHWPHITSLRSTSWLRPRRKRAWRSSKRAHRRYVLV